MSGGVSLQTSVTFKRFELGCWDWSQIEDFFEGDYIRFKKKAFHAASITIFHVFSMIFSRGHATLHLAVSVVPSVGPSVRQSHF